MDSAGGGAHVETGTLIPFGVWIPPKSLPEFLTEQKQIVAPAGWRDQEVFRRRQGVELWLRPAVPVWGSLCGRPPVHTFHRSAGFRKFSNPSGWMWMWRVRGSAKCEVRGEESRRWSAGTWGDALHHISTSPAGQSPHVSITHTSWFPLMAENSNQLCCSFRCSGFETQ